MALEMTSQDCRWLSKTNDAWNAVNGPQLLCLSARLIHFEVGTRAFFHLWGCGVARIPEQMETRTNSRIAMVCHGLPCNEPMGLVTRVDLTLFSGSLLSPAL